MKPRYPFILFDADNTLFDYDRAEGFALEESFRSIGKECTPDTRSTYRRINSSLWKEYEQGLVSNNELRVIRFSRLFDTLGIHADATTFSRTYLDFLSQGAFLIDGAIPMLKSLREMGCRMAIITNGIASVQRSRMADSPVRQFMETLIISDEIEVQKPHTGFFDHSFNTLGLTDKHGVLVVGDSLSSDIKGGNDYGLDTCWFNPTTNPASDGIKPTFTISSLTELPTICRGSE